MNRFLLLFWSLSCAYSSPAQTNELDSLRNVFNTSAVDSIRFAASRPLYTYYEETNRDSALFYTIERLAIARKNNRKIEEAYLLGQKGYQLIYLGRFAEALLCLLQAYETANNPKNDQEDTWPLTVYPSPGKSRQLTLSMVNHMLGHLMQQTGNLDQRLVHFKEGRNIGMAIGNKFRVVVADMMLGSSYVSIDQPDSAFIFAKEGEQYALAGKIEKYYGYLDFVLGDIYLKKGDLHLARDYYERGVNICISQNNATTLAICYSKIIRYHLLTGNKDSVLFFALRNLEVVRGLGGITGTGSDNTNMGTAYENVAVGFKIANQLDSAVKYQSLALAAKDSFNTIRLKNLSDFQNLSFSEQLRLQKVEKEKSAFQNKIRTGGLIAGLSVFLIIALILYRNNKEKQKANKVLESTLVSLKTTQTQLIQSEKMASLGELTAGIAHEIQNPLNFVNNFSEVSAELLDEMEADLANGELAGAKLISDDLKKNLQKITYHGKRADAIVKGMLQHSQSGSGKQEAVNINALAEEYLRLSYHGLRSKDKAFNAILKTEFDESIGTINISPQDVGRVLLNLYNNAFYAVNQKKQAEPDGYEPTVIVRTSKKDKKIEIRVTDNGNGIPQKITEKIFQPFFTTKPTGEGTGLGLSLSYDIVTNGHHGELKVESIEGAGSTFIIILPGSIST